MWLNELSKRWLGWRAMSRRARPQSARPRLELLEDRNLLSVGLIDVVGHLPATEYSQFIQNAVNPQGYPYQDWGLEPSLAVNPLNPNQIAIATFAYGNLVQSGTNASIWYSTDGGADWGIRFPITQQLVPGQFVPNDQVIAYDQSGVLHGAFLSSAFIKTPQDNIFFGSTTDPNADGVNGRPASVWQWNPNQVNLDPQTKNEADRPWLAFGNGHAYVAYSASNSGNGGQGSRQVRVSASADNGITFTIDHNINSTSENGSLSVAANPGQDVATDQLGNVYSFYEWGESPFPNNAHLTTTVHYRLNMSSDGGQSWKFTSLGGKAGGLDVDDGESLQYGASFGGVNLTAFITALAADPSGQHVYPVYGKKDANGVDRIWLAEFHPDGQGGLVERANPVALSVPGQRSALASVAVTANGTVFVMYDSFDGTEFHVHLATSTDFGQTFTDQDLYDFTATGISFPYAGGKELLGDYQFMTAVGNNVYGAFAGRGNVVDPSTGIDTTGYMDPFFFTANAGNGAAGSLANGGNTGSAGALVSGASSLQVGVPTLVSSMLSAPAAGGAVGGSLTAAFAFTLPNPAVTPLPAATIPNGAATPALAGQGIDQFFAAIDPASMTGNQALGGAAGNHGSAGQGIGGGLYVAAFATAGGMDTDITGNFASTDNDDVFGVFNTSC
jgi:hypothetical protein